jgi:uncharacterized protein (DUF305 family)
MTGVETPREHAPEHRRPAWRGQLITVVLAIVAGAVLAAAVMTAVGGDRFPDEGSPEVGFARDMSVHHAQAVQMGEIVRRTTDDDEIGLLASDIVLTQQAQIGQMQGWLDVWDVAPTGTQPAMGWMGMPVEGRMPGMASVEELEALADASGTAADALFLRLMIAHHEAGVDMARAVVERSDHDEVVDLATAMLTAQETEMQTMTDLLDRVESSESTASQDATGEAASAAPSTSMAPTASSQSESSGATPALIGVLCDAAVADSPEAAQRAFGDAHSGLHALARQLQDDDQRVAAGDLLEAKQRVEAAFVDDPVPADLDDRLGRLVATTIDAFEVADGDRPSSCSDRNA